MTCYKIDLPGGGFAIGCTREKRRPPDPCSVCGKPASKLCDGPVEAGGQLVDGRRLCSVWLCTACARTDGGEDFCPLHAKSDDPKAEVGSFGKGSLPPATSADKPHALWKRSQETGENYLELMKQAGHLVPATPSPATAKLEKCKSCAAPIWWALTELARRPIPIDRDTSVGGRFVLTLKKTELIAETFNPEKHAGRNRYDSHFKGCPHGAEWRRREPAQRDFEEVQRAETQAEVRRRGQR